MIYIIQFKIIKIFSIFTLAKNICIAIANVKKTWEYILHTTSLKAINPLLPNGNYSYRIINISFSKKKEGTKKKISYERRVYESVDDERLS